MRKILVIASITSALLLAVYAGVISLSAADKEKPKPKASAFPYPPLFSSDNVVIWDYPIVCCKVKRLDSSGNPIAIQVGDVENNSLYANAGTDLVIVKPDGTEQTLVQGGADAIGDPCVSFDASLIYYTRYYNASPQKNTAPLIPSGSDIFSINVATGTVTQLTWNGYSPNRATDDNNPWTTFNAHPCLAANNRLIFVSNRNRYRAPKTAAETITCTQLYAMDLDGSNVEKIGHLNISSAISPFALRNGTIAFSSEEAQGVRAPMFWSLWGIDPDGTSWYPLFFDGIGKIDPDAFHFGCQLSDGRICVEQYYHGSIFGPFYVWPEPGSPPVFYSANGVVPGTPSLYAKPAGGDGTTYADNVTPAPFQPKGLPNVALSVSPWSNNNDGRAFTDPGSGLQIGKVAHPAASPHNDIICIWSGAGNDGHVLSTMQTQICVIPGGNLTTNVNGMRLLKADPNYNYLFPKALVSYQAIYGMPMPSYPGDLPNDGSLNANLPPGTPYGIVGTASLYKRDSWPLGVDGNGGSPVTSGWQFINNPPPVTATNLLSLWKGILGGDYNNNWISQGAESSIYVNDDVTAIRILLMVPTTDPQLPKPIPGNAAPFLGFGNQANERMRVFGEFPVRKFANGQQTIIDPDGNPDTSFMAKIPGNQPFTFQMLDRNGMMLSMAQTWHQVRPGEMRVNCGGCHAHSQVPTDWTQTAIGKPNYQPFDPATTGTPLLTSKANDTSGQQWDSQNITGLKYVRGVKDVEFYKDIVPILKASCVPCHNSQANPLPGNVAFDNYNQAVGFVMPGNAPVTPKWVPTVYAMLSNNGNGAWGGYPVLGWKGQTNAYSMNNFRNGSRYVRLPEGSRRSLLMWKIWGQRLDGFANADIPTETTPGDPTTLPLVGGQVIDKSQYKLCDINFDGNQCPPIGSVDANGNPIPQLTDDQKRDFARWIDLGMPINFNDPANNNGNPVDSTKGWFQDETPPTLTITTPSRGPNSSLSSISFGVADAYSGVDPTSLSVTADFTIDNNPSGTNLASLFTNNAGVYSYNLQTPLFAFTGNLAVKAQDLQGNRVSMVRHFSVAQQPAPPAPSGLGGILSINLSWQSSPGANSYTIQRSPDGVNWTTIASVTATAYTDSTVPVNSSVYYQVQAVGVGGASPFSPIWPAPPMIRSRVRKANPPPFRVPKKGNVKPGTKPMPAMQPKKVEKEKKR